MTRPMPGPPEDCYCRFGNATCQECETRGYPYSWGLCPGCELHNGRDLGAYKRLKDAECAAETWKAHCKLMIAEHAPFEMRVGLEPALPSVRYVYEADIWHRFATHPHALEES